jgi:hypothetical protein
MPHRQLVSGRGCAVGRAAHDRGGLSGTGGVGDPDRLRRVVLRPAVVLHCGLSSASAHNPVRRELVQKAAP